MNHELNGEFVNPEKTADEAFGSLGQTLTPVFATADVGIAIIDERFRFLTVNQVLASTNGLPIKTHLGKTVRQVLGHVADEVEPQLKRAFGTGENLIFEVAAKMPTRSTTGHWIQTYIPIRDTSKKVIRVCAVVLDVTQRKKLEESLFGLTGKLVYLNARMRTTLSKPSGDSQLTHSLELLEQCTADIFEVLKIVHPAASQSAKKLLSGTDSFSLPEATLQLSTNLSTRRLSQRERQILQLLASNNCNKEIAFACGISVRTVESHRRRIMEKLGLHSLVELIRFAIRHGIVEA